MHEVSLPTRPNLRDTLGISVASARQKGPRDKANSGGCHNVDFRRYVA
jgi:hypothetical protein